MDVNKNQNLELLLDVTYFSNFLAIERLQALSYTKPWNANKIGFDSDGEGAISILIQII